MTFEGYDAFEDPYAYPGTSVLRNLLDIPDQATLSAYEVEISTLRAEEPLPEGDFDPEHYCRIHRHLFQDVYEWAGQYRTVRTSKGGNVFCYPENIAAQMDSLFGSIRGLEVFRGVTSEMFLEHGARFLGELNAIHPFREGNGRSQLSFLGLIGATVGHALVFERLDRNSFMPAMIASYSGNCQALKAELRKLLT